MRRSLRALILLTPLAAPPAGAAPTLAGCPLLPADNIWNTPVDQLPRAERSDAYVSAIGATAHLHPDFGAGTWNGGPIGIPFVVVPADQPAVPVSFGYADESDPGPYPIPPGAPVEGGPQADGDRHVLLLQQGSCKLYELYYAYPKADGSWSAGSGAVFDLNSNALRPAGWTSADAAGLPILPGLVRYEEVAAGEITHAIRFTAPSTQRAYLWPARHYASSITDPNYPPMGQRFRLKSEYDISRFSAPTQVILRALKRYGMVLADNGSPWFLSGVPDDRWNNDALVPELHSIPGSAFEAVELSGLMVHPDSGQAAGAGGPEGAALLARARAAVPARAAFADAQGAQSAVTADGRSFYLWWAPAGWNGGVIATLHGHGSWAFDEFQLWHSYAAERGLAVLALQWWFGEGEADTDYYTPPELHAQLEAVLAARGVAPGAALLHGFSRGAAVSYAVAARDAAAARRFALVVSNAGGAAADFPYNRELSAGSYGPAPLAGIDWVLWCGGKDPNPERDGCPAMEAARDWVRGLGARVLLLREDGQADHGGFHAGGANLQAALNLFAKANPYAAAEAVFNWAESAYPGLLHPAGAVSAFANPYWHRCYAGGICTGTDGLQLGYYDGAVHTVGTAADFADELAASGGPIVRFGF